MKKSIVALGFGLLSLTCTAHANLITNGSFENGNFFGNHIFNGDGTWVELTHGDGDLTGWDVLPGTNPQRMANWHQDYNFTSGGGIGSVSNPRPAQDGRRMVDLNDKSNGLTAGLYQDFTTAAGQRYTLTFWGAAPAFQDRSVRVDVGDVANRLFTLVSSPSDALSWAQLTLDFTATGTTTRLQFESQSNCCFWGPFIDNVSVVEAGQVPAPATLLLLGMGLLGLRIARRP